MQSGSGGIPNPTPKVFDVLGGSEPFSEVALVVKNLEKAESKIAAQQGSKSLIFSEGGSGASSSAAKARPVPAQKTAPSAGSSSAGGGEPSTLTWWNNFRNNARLQPAHAPTDLSLSRNINGKSAESVGKKGLIRARYETQNCRLPGNRGFDHVGLKYGADGAVSDILIVESKFVRTGTG